MNKPTICLLRAFFISVAISHSASLAAANEPFEIDDYFRVQRVTELAISSNGELIAYAAEQQSLEKNKTVRTVYVSATAPDSEPVLIVEIQNATSLAWIPRSGDLAFLMTPAGEKDGKPEVFSINPQTKKLKRRTRAEHAVTAFRFAPDGGALAYVTRAGAALGTPLYDQFYDGETGVVTDPETLNVYHFLDKDQRNWLDRPKHRLWISRAAGAPTQISVSDEVKAVHWSPDGKHLSVAFIADDLPEDASSTKYTSLGIVEIATRAGDVIAKAMPAADGRQAIYYTGGEWLPGGERIHIRQLVEQNAWHSKAEWAIVQVSAAPDLASTHWRPIEHGRDDAFVATGPATFYLQKVVNAVDALYRLSLDGLTRAEMIEGLPGAAKFFDFSGDFKTAVFVNESLNTPPEIYRWTEGERPQKLTDLNGAVAAWIALEWREVAWAGKDGASVRGWLITPAGATGPQPIVTFVHGGPGFPMRNEFAYYLLGRGGVWPHPFLSYAQAGMSVFLPNYRGTQSFGFEHGTPEALDGAPVDDIVAGVDHLIRAGIADPARLAIAGHSHGAWLAPMVMVRDRRYVAGSFAEGSQNAIVNYSLMPMYLNKITHDVQRGASLYDDPQLYIDNSPDLHFQGIDTAMLFEAGATSLSVGMIGSQKAARRAGLPAEYVVYPQTGHNIQKPRLQRESAVRNLDWFLFWLQGFEDPALEKADQYARWRAMRDEQCERLQGEDPPWYCRP